MKIHRDGVAIYDLAIDERTTIKRRLMVENSLNLLITTAINEPLKFKIGDYTDIADERYIIMTEPRRALSGGVYSHTVLMRGNLHRLEVYMMPDEGRDAWYYFGSVIAQIDKVISVLNTKESGWSVAQYPNITTLADNSPRNINYANMSILSALHAICSVENGFGLEFDVIGKTIKFAKEIKSDSTLRFEHGRGKGLYEMDAGATSDAINTRIIGYGGTANMPNAQRLSFADINDGKNYIEKNVDLYGLREARVNFDHIFPRRNGSITSDAVQLEAGKANWTVKDTTLDFDLNQQIVEGAIIMFNTGDCVGLEFEIVTYDTATKTITFKEHADDSGVETYVLPNALRYPKAGNEYVLVNILMPDSYIAAAKQELKAATVEEVDKQSSPKRSYLVKCDPRYIMGLAAKPMVGDSVRLVDSVHNVDYASRITELNYAVIFPNQITIGVADTIVIPAGVVMAKSIKELKVKMAMLDRGNITEDYLRKIFHPLGGGVDKDFAAKEIKAVSVTTNIVEAPMIKTPNYETGALGSGGALTEDPDTKESTLTVHNVVAKNGITAPVFTARIMEATGGMDITSAATAKLTNVADGGSHWQCFYKCAGQLWKPLDQARIQSEFGGFLWGLVTAVSEQPNAKGEYWFNISKTTVADGSNVAPKIDDTVVLYGHRGADKYRQSLFIKSCGVDNPGEDYEPYEAKYVAINSFSLPKSKCTKWDGLTFDIAVNSFTIMGRDGNLYRQPNDRGAWADISTAQGARVCYEFDRVAHDGSIWQCVAAQTTDTPSGASAAWVCVVPKGESPYALTFQASAGAEFYREGQEYNATIRATLHSGVVDVSDMLHRSCWRWRRESQTPAGDEIWNALHEIVGREIILTEADLSGDTTFRLTVYAADNTHLADRVISLLRG